MLSRDSLGLDPVSQTALRWKMLRDQGIELEVLVLSSQAKDWSEQGICVRGTGGGTIFHRLWNLFQEGKRVTKPDLITVQDVAEMAFVGWRLSRFYGVPCELQDHGGYFDGGVIDEPLWSIRGRLAEWMIRRVQLIRTVSTGSLKGLQKRGLTSYRYWLPIVANERFAQLPYQPEPGHLVTVGRLVSVKRHDLLLRAFAELKKISSNVRLTIVGEGPNRSSLEDLAQRLAVRSSVEFVGQADPAPFLERAELFPFFSLHEGWGVAPVEAAMLGIPVAMFETGCGPWLAEQGNARILSTTDPLEIAQQLYKMLGQHTRPLSSLLTAEQGAKQQVEQWKSFFFNT